MSHKPETLSRRAWLGAALALAACHRKSSLPELGHVPEFSLVDQDGRQVERAELRGKVWAVAFMFTRCPTICPRITRFMRRLQLSAAATGTELRLVSISVDPENDTPAVLRAYANTYQADTSTWSFLTGDFRVIQATAVDGFKLALEGKANASAGDFGIVHGSHLVLVDPKLVIRGYYRTDDDSEGARLLTDARSLV